MLYHLECMIVWHLCHKANVWLVLFYNHTEKCTKPNVKISVSSSMTVF